MNEEMGRQKITIMQHDHTLSNLQQQFDQLLQKGSVYQQSGERIDMGCPSRPFMDAPPGDSMTSSLFPQAPPFVSSSAHRMKRVPVQRPTLYDGKTPWDAYRIQYEMSHEKEGAEETDQLQEERERAVQEQKSQQEAESQKGAESQEEERQER